MRELWTTAFEEFEKLTAMTPMDARARMAEIERDHPPLAALIAKLHAEPAISLQPLPWGNTTPMMDATISDEAEVAAGQRLGAYTLVREIGRGGMGTVWLGERADGLYHGQVAIKLLSGRVLANAAALQRFAREGEILSKLAHPNIARLLDAGTTNLGARYLVLEYVDGVSLRQYCESNSVGLTDTIELFSQALEAVSYAHSLLILHRDIKPGNVLVTNQGQVKLLDFGLGKLLQPTDKAHGFDGAPVSDDMTRVGGIGYTPRYSPPEQMSGATMSTASDVYSLGVTLYEILTGEKLDVAQHYTRPSERLNASSTRNNWSREVKGDLDSIIAKAVSERPADRYGNAAAMLDDLRRFIRNEPVTAQPDTNIYRTGKFVRRHQWAVGSAGLATLLVLGSFGVSLWQWSEARKQRTEAQLQAGTARTTLEILDAVNEDVPQAASGASTRAQIDRGFAIVTAMTDIDPLVRASVLASFASRYSDIGEIEQGMRVRKRALDLLAPMGIESSRVQNLRDDILCTQIWDKAVTQPKEAKEEIEQRASEVTRRASASVDAKLSCLIAATSISSDQSDQKQSRVFAEHGLTLLQQAKPDEVSIGLSYSIRSVHSGNLANRGELAKSTQILRTLRDEIKRRGLESGVKWAYVVEYLAWQSMMGGDIVAARQWVKDEYPRLRAIKGEQNLPTRTYTVLARYALWNGDTQQALEWINQTLAATQRNPSTANEEKSIDLRDLIYVYGTDPALANDAIKRLRAKRPPQTAQKKVLVSAIAEAAYALFHSGKIKEARAILAPYIVSGEKYSLTQNGVWLLAAEAAQRDGDASEALKLCRMARVDAEQTAVDPATSIWVGRALFCEADALAASGDNSGAATARTRATTIWRSALPTDHFGFKEPLRLVPRVS